MKASELIKELEKMKELLGDVEVCFDDTEYGFVDITDIDRETTSAFGKPLAQAIVLSNEPL